MYFEQFCKETKKVELSVLPKTAREIYGEYELIPATTEVKVVRGLHFPNDVELLELWNIMTPQIASDELTHYDKIRTQGEKSSLDSFVNNVKKAFNIDFMDTGNFDETFARIKYKWKKKNIYTINTKELIGLFEELYLKTDSDLLNNDIRIRALNLNSKTNIILDFEQANRIWYEGKPYVGRNIKNN
jgi:hypothetical protein